MKASFRSALEAGRPQLGCFVMYPSAGAIERIGPDWDWLWIDGQHGQMGYNDLLGLVRACEVVGRPAMVRVPSGDRGWIGLVLDMAVAGVIVPQVNSVQEARAAVAAAKFAPLGERSYGGRRPIDLYGRGYAETANRETLLMVQVESPDGLEELEAIAGTDGVDCIGLGPDDIALRLGQPMSRPRPRDAMGKELERLAEACRRHGKFWAAIGVEGEMMSMAVRLGVNLIVAGGDVRFLAEGSRRASRAAREIIGRARGGEKGAGGGEPGE
ncbi:MAG: HpcH/HpaI aldolase/citrate lyase family protein [Phycisphaerae bacterium]